MYPRPASEWLHLEWQGLEVTTVQLMLVDGQGRKVAAGLPDQVQLMPGEQVRLPLQQVADGNYWLQVQAAQAGRSSFPVLVQRN